MNRQEARVIGHLFNAYMDDRPVHMWIRTGRRGDEQDYTINRKHAMALAQQGYVRFTRPRAKYALLTPLGLGAAKRIAADAKDAA